MKEDVLFPTIKLPQPDGSLLLRPGKPVVLSEKISTAQAAKILGLSQRRVESLCDEGHFAEGRDWIRPGKSKYFLYRAAVVKRLGAAAEEPPPPSSSAGAPLAPGQPMALRPRNDRAPAANK